MYPCGREVLEEEIAMKPTQVGLWSVILAGGDGKRLLPLTSRLAGDARPKQFCCASRWYRAASRASASTAPRSRGCCRSGRLEVTAAARYAGRETFLAVAGRELLYITMYSVLLEALASEHGARLAATQSAEEWLDERAERLRRQLASTRREASTQEAIEIAGGARARSRMARTAPVEVRKRGA